MTILEKIIEHKLQEVATTKKQVPLTSLVTSPYFKEPGHSIKKALKKQGSSGIIAEFKRKSPSLNWINEQADIRTISEGYAQAGAAALSILTDNHFFGGHNVDVLSARKRVNLPILRKEFIIDEYQLFEAKSIGADVILLIAECLTKQQVKNLSNTAKSLGLEVLLELHSSEQLDKICDTIDCVGINNRNLKTFEVNIQYSKDLAKQIPDNFIKISESGITNPETIIDLRQHGFKGFLIGEAFMKTQNPAHALEMFIKKSQ
jgi:indole-3-glycerol phosphate synthase